MSCVSPTKNDEAAAVDFEVGSNALLLMLTSVSVQLLLTSHLNSQPKANCGLRFTDEHVIHFAPE